MSAQPYLGAIFIFAGNFAPRGFALCQGQLLSISQNTALFSIIGTTYGGDGVTTFGLPDLRGRAPVGQGNGPGLNPVVLGELTGTNNVSILTGNMPQHNHMVNVSTANGTLATPQNNFPAVDAVSHPVPEFPGITPYASAATAGATLAPTAVTVAGGSQPLSIQNPILGISYIIALQGIFPTRN